MNIVALDIDPTTVKVRGRDTEHLPTEHPPGEWGEWQTVAQMMALPDPTDAYILTFLLASQMLAAGNFNGSVTVTCNVTLEGKPDRTVDYEVALA